MKEEIDSQVINTISSPLRRLKGFPSQVSQLCHLSLSLSLLFSSLLSLSSLLFSLSLSLSLSRSLARPQLLTQGRRLLYYETQGLVCCPALPCFPGVAFIYQNSYHAENVLGSTPGVKYAPRAREPTGALCKYLGDQNLLLK